MIIVSYGVRKSGSTLAFELARAVLQESGYAQPALSVELLGLRRDHNVVQVWMPDRLEALVDAARRARLVIKTHGHPRRLMERRVRDLLDAGELKIHLVYRDPRDTVLSVIDESRHKPHKPPRHTLDAAMEPVKHQVEKLRDWGAFPSLKLCYDDFAFDPVLGPKLIADDLGVTVDMRAVWARVSGRFTRLNVGRPHRWKTEMSPEDAATVEAAFPDYLRLVEQGDLSFFSPPGRDAPRAGARP